MRWLSSGVIHNLNKGGAILITKEDWQEIEQKLKSFYNVVKLNCDGYEISLTLERLDTMKNGIMVYVNGVIKGEWLTEECEERRRFYRPITRSLMSQKQRNNLKKLPKRTQNMLIKELKLDRTFTYYSFEWTSFNSLKRHLIKNNTNIELIRSDKSLEEY